MAAPNSVSRVVTISIGVCEVMADQYPPARRTERAM